MTPTSWHLTEHARDQLAERAIAPSELVALLDHPDVILPGAARLPGSARYVRGSVMALVDVQRRAVVTVMLDGSSKDDWEADVLEPREAIVSLEDVTAMLERLEPASSSRRSSSKRRDGGPGRDARRPGRSIAGSARARDTDSQGSLRPGRRRPAHSRPRSVAIRVRPRVKAAHPGARWHGAPGWARRASDA